MMRNNRFQARRRTSRSPGILVALLLGLPLLATSMMTAAPAWAATEPLLRVGDRLKVTIFEMMEVSDTTEADKGAPREAPSPLLQTVYPRVDLSGEYTVEPGGTVVLPLFGAIEAVGRPASAFRADLGEAFDRLFHRRCNITVSMLQRAPIYVVGAVRNPGSFPYAPGLMVIQAVALAGGDIENGTPAQAIETTREQERRDGARDRLKGLLARRAVLVAERDGAAIGKAPALRDLIGADASAALLASEQRMAQLRAQNLASARATRERAIAAIHDEIELLRQRMANFDAQIKVRGERLKMMEALFARQVVENERVADVRRDYVDMEGRRRDIEISLLQAEQRQDTAKKALEQGELERRLNLERDLALVESEIQQAERAYAALNTTAALMARTGPAPTREAGILVYDVVRRTGEVTESIRAAELDALEPGDVLRVRVAQAERVKATDQVAEK
jgi:polysaccharide biosynthesis/export protein ExoF